MNRHGIALGCVVVGASLLATVAAQSSSNAIDKPTTLFIVRHTEKVAKTRDAALSQAGRERARTLAWILRDVRFDAVYSTDFARTRDTVAAIARTNDVELSLYSAGSGESLKELQTGHAGHTVLVCGHSDTVPSLLAALGAPINDKILPGYDDLFIVTLNPRRGASLQRLHYPRRR